MEMRGKNGHIIKQCLRCCSIIFIMLLCSARGIGQGPTKLCTVKNGRMLIVLSKALPEQELNDFVKKFDLYNLGLKRFARTGNDDSIKLAGWKIDANTKTSFTLSKPLLSSNDVNNASDRIIFSESNPSFDAMFPSVSNDVVYGYNRFRNKQSFIIRNSIVTFFLRNNLRATKVKLSGSFNKWDPNSLSMIKTDSGWIAQVKLSPGKYWYKFIVDGNWITDTDNRLSENDGLGNTNSVFYYTNTMFHLDGYANAKNVFLAGSFNNWKEDQLSMGRTTSGWELPVYLAEGTHQYRFIVDHNWMADPTNKNRLPNGHGDFNSVVTLGKPHFFKLDGHTDATSVILTGSFNGWKDNELLMKKTARGWELPYVLGPGNYEYKFLVDGKPMNDPLNPAVIAKGNSVLILDPNYTFRLKEFEMATKVFIAGNFNNWSPNSFSMKKENKEWVFQLHLSPGKYLYKFIVDGKWIIDPANKLWEQNANNTGNSVLWVEKQ